MWVQGSTAASEWVGGITERGRGVESVWAGEGASERGARVNRVRSHIRAFGPKGIRKMYIMYVRYLGHRI